MSFALKAIALAAVLAAALPAQDDLRAIYAEAQRAQASGDLATATLKYEAIVRLEPDEWRKPTPTLETFITNREKLCGQRRRIRRLSN